MKMVKVDTYVWVLLALIPLSSMCANRDPESNWLSTSAAWINSLKSGIGNATTATQRYTGRAYHLLPEYMRHTIERAGHKIKNIPRTPLSSWSRGTFSMVRTLRSENDNLAIALMLYPLFVNTALLTPDIWQRIMQYKNELSATETEPFITASADDTAHDITEIVATIPPLVGLHVKDAPFTSNELSQIQAIAAAMNRVPMISEAAIHMANAYINQRYSQKESLI